MNATGISVVGLGKLGACMAACFARRGFTVVGVDADPRVVEAVNRGDAPVQEPDLADTIRAARSRIRATMDFTAAVRSTDATFIVVPTPSLPDGAFSLEHVLRAGRSIGEAVRTKASPHLVVLASTVLPGSTGEALGRILEETSGRRLGPELGLCYNPAFIALGRVIRDLLRPDFVLIGAADPAWAERLAEIQRTTCENQPRVVRMNLVNAEITKLALNSYVTTKITFANLLADLCERVPGGDVDVVTGALGLDPRIGPQYLKGSLGYGGPCFPRDNRALANLLRALGVPAGLPEVVHAFNEYLPGRVADKALELLGSTPGRRVTVLGLAYKPDTPVAEQSQGLRVAQRLVAAGVQVTVHDPAAGPDARRVLGDTVRYAANLEDAVAEADVVVLATPWSDYRRWPPVRAGSRAPVVLDAWRILDPSVRPAGSGYVPLGVGEPSTSKADRLRRFIDAVVDQRVARPSARPARPIVPRRRRRAPAR